MAFVATLDLIVIVTLIGVALTRGFERTLPLAAGLMMMFPNESQLQLPGLFDMTTQRLIVITLMILYITVGRKERSGRNSTVPLRCLIGFQIVWLLISAINSVVVAVSIKTVLSQVCEYLGLFYIFTKTISSREMAHRVLRAVVAAMIVCSGLGVLEIYNGWEVLSLFPIVGHRFTGGGLAVVSDRGGRVQTVFGHPILFGGTLAMAIPLGLYLISQTKKILPKIMLWVGVMLMFINIYKTASRGPWLAVILSLGILLVFGTSQLRKYLSYIIALTATVLVLRPGVRDTIKNIYYATEDPESPAGQSYEWRYALYRVARERLAADVGRALWGYGPESFFYLHIQAEFQGRIVSYDSCDSSIAAIMIESGYVGLVVVLAPLVRAALFAVRCFRRMPKPSNALCLVLLTNMAAFYFLMTNVAIYGWGQQTYLLWIVIGLSMVYPRMRGTAQGAGLGKTARMQEASICAGPHVARC